MTQEKQVRSIIVKVDTGNSGNQLKKVADEFKRMNRSVKDSADTLRFFKNAFLAISSFSFAGLGVRELVQTADGLQKLIDRIGALEGSAEKGFSTFQKLTDVANKNLTSIEDASVVYSRLGLALGDAGASTESLLAVTDVLQQTFRLSGSTAAEATAATIQLSQGLASGQIRGQELRSVLEQNVVVGKLLADQLGVTRGQLLKFAEKEEGISATQFLRAVAKGMEDVDAQAKKLRPTVGEALTVAFNDFKVGLAAFNKEFEVTNKIVSFIQFLTANAKPLAVGITSVGAAWLVYAKGATAAAAANALLAGFFASPIIGSIVKFGIVLGGAALAANPFTLAIGGIVTALTGLALYFDTTREKIVSFFQLGNDSNSKSLSQRYNEQQNAAKAAAEEVEKYRVKQQILALETPDIIKAFQGTIKKMQEVGTSVNPAKKAIEDLANSLDVKKLDTRSAKQRLEELNKAFSEGRVSVENYNKGALALTTEIYKKKGPVPLGEALDKVRRESLQRLFEYGKIGAEEFQSRLNSLNITELENKFKSGRITQLEYVEGLRKISDEVFEVNERMRASKIIEYNKQYADGILPLSEYNVKMQNLRIDELNDKFKRGTMDVYEYNKALIETSDKFLPGSALFVGTQNYINQAGTLSQNIATVVTNTFGNLENSMIEFTKRGTFEFRKFAEAVLDDLNRIIIRSLIIRPLAQGIIGAIPTDTGTSAPVSNAGATDAARNTSNVAAKGAAFDGMRSNFFAAGGVVSGRTGFSYAGGRKGIMGEAGPEAILPLSRTRSGDLGVVAQGAGSNVVVNVVNNSGSEVQQRESTGPNGERTIDIIIARKIKETFASGAMDAQMAQQYNIRRRGV